MRALFVSSQIPGHLDWGGYLKTAIALREAGHQVLWASGKAVENLINRAKVPFAPMQHTGWRWPPPPSSPQHSEKSVNELNQQRAQRALDQWLDVERVALATVDLLEVAQRFDPDLLVAENFMSAGALVAEMMEVPFAVAGWPAVEISATPATQAVIDLGRRRLASLLKRFEIQGINWSSNGPPALRSPHLHLTYWSPSWYKGVSLLPQTRHVGGAAAPPDRSGANSISQWLLNREEITELPWVFVTLGTSFSDDLNFFVHASRAVEAVGALPIVALGRRPPKAFMDQLNARAARSSILVPTLEFNQILPHVSAAIHHGGAGTTHALVIQAIPQILVPHAADQMHGVRGVTQCGVGVGIRPQNVTVSALAQLLEEMLSESSPFQTNAQKLQAEFAQLGGVARAVEYLNAVVARRG